MTVTGAAPPSAGDARHASSPVVSRTAARPRTGCVRVTRKYPISLSAAEPHMMGPPPVSRPRPTCRLHTTSPFLSGSSAQAWPSFWPMTISERPSRSVRKIGALPKSMSGPRSSGHVSDLLSVGTLGRYRPGQIAHVRVVRHHLPGPEPRTGVEIEGDDRVGGIGRRLRVAVAGRHVHGSPLDVHGRSRPHARARGSPQLHAPRGLFDRQRFLLNRVRLPQPLAADRVVDGEAAPERAARIVRTAGARLLE